MSHACTDRVLGLVMLYNVDNETRYFRLWQGFNEDLANVVCKAAEHLSVFVCVGVQHQIQNLLV